MQNFRGNNEALIDQLKKSNDIIEQYERIMDAISGPFFWKDSDGVYLGCNDYLGKLIGKNKAYIIGKTDEMLWPEYADSFKANDALVMKSGKTLVREKTFLGRVYLSVKTPLRNQQDAIIGSIGHSIDITDLKKTERHLKEVKELAEATRILGKQQFSFLD